MPKRFGILLLLLLLSGPRAGAQHPDDEYYPYAGREEPRAMLETDSMLFYRAVQSVRDFYGECSDFNLPQVLILRRGFGYDAERSWCSGIEVPYRSLGLLRLLGAEETFHPGLTPAEGLAGAAGGTRVVRFGGSEPLQPYQVSARFTDRSYRFGARVAASGTWGRGWRYSAGLDARTGPDMHVEGLFTHAVTPGVYAAKRFSGGLCLSFAAVVPLSIRGTRLSSSEEAFTLTGDRLYNPAWGFQEGKVRNSRVRREMLPLTLLACELPLGAATVLEASCGVEAGTSKYSMLDWFDARTPMPDNYRCLPSYTGDRETEQVWLSRDPHYTQIDWDELIRQNRMAGGEAVYTLSDRVTRLTRTDFRLLLTTRPDARLTLRCGLAVGRRAERFYKQMRDLLGAGYLTDIDQYLIDDDTYGNLFQNDLRHPDRRIVRGDRFGYDYRLTHRRAELLFEGSYRSDRLRADFSASLGDDAVVRRGFYEKELFPGAQSCGPSRTLHFTPWTLKATVGWSFATWRYLEVSALAAAHTPEAAMLFYQPLYNNRTVENPVCERTWAAEMTYRRTGERFEWQATLFAAMTLDGMETRRYYDDMSAVYCDMATTGIGLLRAGVELGASLRLSYRWRLSLAASAGRYRYIRDPQVTVLSDVDNTAVDVGATSHMGGCTIGGAPQLTAAAEGSWFGPKGWGAGVSMGYAGIRYVEPMPLRRTDRIASQAGITPEAFEAFTHQQRLPDAVTLDASLFKTFYFERSRLTVSLLLHNLLGDSDVIYNGYESLRVRRVTAGDATFYTPHATRYTYAWPRSFYLTVSYRF